MQNMQNENERQEMKKMCRNTVMQKNAEKKKIKTAKVQKEKKKQKKGIKRQKEKTNGKMI